MAPPNPAQLKKPSPAPRPRLDFSTFAGIAIAVAGIIGGLLSEKGDVMDIAQMTAAMIVLGGTCGAVLVTTPMPIALRALRALRSMLFENSRDAAEMASRLIHLSADARRNGILSLETQVAAIPDPFLRKAMSLAIDGTELHELRRMMEIDIEVMEHNAEAEAKVWESAGGYA